MSSRRIFVLLLSAVLFLANFALPRPALANVRSPQYAGAASKSAFPDVPEANDDFNASSVWALKDVNEAAGFTEAAVAFDSDPLRHPGSTALSAESLSHTAGETPSGAKVPEPAALVLFGTALIGIARAARERTRG